MPKLSELKTAAQVATEELADPGIRREHERTALAHAVAMRVIGYRIDHGLSQTGLARLLDVHQSAVARLEASDHELSLATLSCWRGCSGSSSISTSPRTPSSCATPPESTPTCPRTSRSSSSLTSPRPTAHGW